MHNEVASDRNVYTLQQFFVLSGSTEPRNSASGIPFLAQKCGH